VWRKLVALLPSEELPAGRRSPRSEKRLFTLFGDRFMIDSPAFEGLGLVGDLFEHVFPVQWGNRRWRPSLVQRARDLRVGVGPGEDDLFILAGVLALDLAEDGNATDRSDASQSGAQSLNDLAALAPGRGMIGALLAHQAAADDVTTPEIAS
jgi:hypothetical protein